MATNDLFAGVTIGVACIESFEISEINPIFKEFQRINESAEVLSFVAYISHIVKSEELRRSEHQFMLALGVHVSIEFQIDRTGSGFIFVKDISKTIEAQEASKAKMLAFDQLLKSVDVLRKKDREQASINIASITMPYLSQLKDRLDEKGKSIIDIIEYSISTFDTGFTLNTVKYLSALSKKEMEVCTLIKHGRGNKEIASMLNISLVTVETHRKNIRKKLNICDKSVNLNTYLKSLSVD